MNGRIAARFLAALLLAAPAVPAQPIPPGAADCLAALRQAALEQAAQAEPGTMPPTIGDYCPAFASALASSDWGGDLVTGDPGALDGAALESLMSVAGRYGDGAETGLAVDRLDELVAALEPFAPPEGQSLMDRIGEWFRSWFRSAGGDPTWLGRLLESIAIPAAWIPYIIYGLAITLGLAVLAVLINELRASGLFLARQGRRALLAAGAAQAEVQAIVPTLEAIRSAGDARRGIEMLFALVVDRLRRRRPEALSSALTHRELERAVPELDARARESLRDVAGAAERVTYSSWLPDEASFDGIYANAASLVRRLDDEPAEAR